MLYSGKVFKIGKVIVFGQKWLYSGKVVVFEQKWIQAKYSGKSELHSGKSGCFKVVVFGHWW